MARSPSPCPFKMRTISLRSAQTLKLTQTLRDTLTKLAMSPDEITDAQITDFVGEQAMPVTKEWAIGKDGYGYKEGVLKMKNRPYKEPQAHADVLKVFKELQRIVSQPKKGVPIKRLTPEEKDYIFKLLDNVDSEMA